MTLSKEETVGEADRYLLGLIDAVKTFTPVGHATYIPLSTKQLRLTGQNTIQGKFSWCAKVGW